MSELRLNALRMAVDILGSDARNQEKLFNCAESLIQFVENKTPQNISIDSNPKFKITEEMIAKFQLYEKDPTTFISENITVQHPIKGAIPFQMYDFQKELIDLYHSYKMTIVNTARQMGTTTTTASYVLWYALFKPNRTTLVLGRRNSAAQEIGDRIKFQYDNLPNELKPSVITYSKSSLEFDNGSRILFRPVTPDSGRGMAVSLLWVDDAAFVSHSLMADFWTNMQPALSTGASCIITSSPGVEDGVFYNLWEGANRVLDQYGMNRPDGLGANGFKAQVLPYTRHPDRDKTWAEWAMNAYGADKFAQEFLCQFKKV